jgi:hypothetical protein
MFHFNHGVRRVLVMGLALVTLFLAFPGGSAQAHGHIDVGDYQLTIGFLNEPAYAGEPNGLDLLVMRHAEGEEHQEEGEEHHEEGEEHAEAAEPVRGLEETLHVEIVYGSSSRELELRPQWGVEGAYTADVLPTAAGDYTWHIWGDIEGTPVDVEMTSSPDTFSSVEAKADLSFPAAEQTAAELQAQAQTAMWVGVAGAILGLAGLITGVVSLQAARSARSS